MSDTKAKAELDQVLEERFGGSLTLFQEVVDLAVARAPDQLTALRDALARRDFDKAEQAAHGLKGLVSLFHRTELWMKVSDLEDRARAKTLDFAAVDVRQLELEFSLVVSALRSFLRAA